MNNYDLSKIGDRIKQAREHAGYTRDTLAETMYITRSAIAKWEQGKNIPRLPELMSLSEILCVDINRFCCIQL